MAYTHTWRTTVPSIMVPTNALDDHIRRLRLEVQERMTHTGIDWTADPITSTTTRYMYLHWSQFKALNEAVGARTWTVTNTGLSYNAALTSALHAGIILARNCVLVDVHLSCATGADGTIPWSLEYVDVTTGTPAQTVLGSGTISANTAQGNQALVTSLNHTIDNTPSNYKYYSLILTFTQTNTTGGPIIQGVRVRYTTPNVIVSSV